MEILNHLPVVNVSDRQVFFDNDIYYDVGWGDPERHLNNTMSTFYLNENDPRIRAPNY